MRKEKSRENSNGAMASFFFFFLFVKINDRGVNVVTHIIGNEGRAFERERIKPL